MEVKRNDFGRFNGQPVELFTVTNGSGNSIAVTGFGATLVSATVPDRDGKKADVVLGYSDMEGYLSDTCYLGRSVGRFANRIALGRFFLDGIEYRLPQNSGENCLHGGVQGLSSRVWEGKVEEDGVTFSTVSPDGEEGFPGELRVSVRYRWSEDNRLTMEFTATTDKATPVSLTSHAYFNLAGESSGDAMGQELKVYADAFLPMLPGGVVVGNVAPVEGTPFDFTEPKALGRDIEAKHSQIENCKGYDQSFLLKNRDDGRMRIAAEAFDPASGRAMTMSTTYPTVHLYTANYLGGTLPGKDGRVYGEREAFCLEAQYAPNSPNLPAMPSCILRPGHTYSHKIEIHFKTA